jgi:hypothetical protein
VTERPILFSDAMVRAILAGTKTQTRRVIAGASGAFWDHRSYTGTVERDGVLRFRVGPDGEIANGSPEVRCPHGAVGDRLWVREAWRAEERASDLVDGVRFRSDDVFVPIQNTPEAAEAWVDAYDNGRHKQRWRPSIFLPRWASRLTLEVTSVRVERVQSISEEDARAEGFTRHAAGWSAGGRGYDALTARYAFAELWDSINGTRPGCSWSANPWVWCVSFKHVKGT